MLDVLTKSLTLVHQAVNRFAQAPSSRQRLLNLYPKVLRANVHPNQTVLAGPQLTLRRALG